MLDKAIEDISRRDFGKTILGLGAATAISPFGNVKLEAKEKSFQNFRNKHILPSGKPAIRVDSKTFKPMKQTNLAFFYRKRIIKTDENGKKIHWGPLMMRRKIEFLNKSQFTHELKAPSIKEARSAYSIDRAAWSLADRVGEDENRGFLKWNANNRLKDTTAKMNDQETDLETLTLQTKFTARLAGADLVGIAPLNRDWVYTDAVSKDEQTHERSIKNIVFKDVEEPEETETELIIPNSVNNVVVSAIAMNREMLQTAPTLMANAATGLGYSRMALHDIALCDFIRNMGYIAIPCVNNTAMSVPMAIEAGLGEGSRMGTLITPEYGPNVRITKVLTNMPLNHDKAIEFGVQKFCETCKKCARECPSKCITEGEQSFKARDIHNQEGVLKWQNDYQKCHDYWVKSAGSCSICVAVCPFTKGDIWIHDGVEWAIKNASFLDPVMLGMDDSMGYGERREIKDVWNGPINTYGLDADHFQDTKKIYGGKK